MKRQDCFRLSLIKIVCWVENPSNCGFSPF